MQEGGFGEGMEKRDGRGGVVSYRWPLIFSRNVGPCGSTLLNCTWRIFQHKPRATVFNNAGDEYIDSVPEVYIKYANIILLHARGWVWRGDGEEGREGRRC